MNNGTPLDYQPAFFVLLHQRKLLDLPLTPTRLALDLLFSIQFAEETAMPQRTQTLLCAHTPDPDDAYAWWALATGEISVSARPVTLVTEPIQTINERCLAGHYDIAAVSSAAWPHLCDDYEILSAGASVGRGYGPALVSRRPRSDRDIRHATVAVPGKLTTGALLLQMFFPGVRTVALPFDRIAQAILEGTVDAGVLIHEELMNWRHKGLHGVACLGERWQEATGLPIVVGLNVAHRRLGPRLLGEANHALRQSMVLAGRHSRQATVWAMAHSMQSADGIGEQFIRMFANRDTEALAPDCIQSLCELYQRAFAMRLIPCLPRVKPIVGHAGRHSKQMHDANRHSKRSMPAGKHR